MNLFKKITAVTAVAALMLAFTSCEIETRDTYEIDSSGAHTITYEKGEEPTMNLAEKTNDVSAGNDIGSDTIKDAIDSTLQNGPDEGKEVTEIKVCITGDIKIDGTIIEDSRKAAEDVEGRDYSFLRLYTGAYRLINDADLAFCSYSSALNPVGVKSDYDYTEDETTGALTTPKEALTAISDAGFDVVDTSGAGGAGDCDSLFADTEMLNVSTSVSDYDAIQTVEISGVTFGFVAVDTSDDEDKTKERTDTLEYADVMSDILVVSVHWGSEMSFDDKEAFAMDIANAGADIIVGDGDAVSEIKWIETDDGTSTLVAYSLGNLVSNADEGYRLVSGVLSFTVLVDDNMLEMTDTLVIPVFMFYDGERSGFQVYKLEDCNSEVLSRHGAEVSKDGLIDFIKGRISSEFLPATLAG